MDKELISDIRRICDRLHQAGVLTIDISAHHNIHRKYGDYPVFVRADRLQAIADAASTEVKIKPASPGCWWGYVVHKGLVFHSLFKAEQLPLIGYTVPDTPQPVKKVADQSAASQQQPTLPQESGTTA